MTACVFDRSFWGAHSKVMRGCSTWEFFEYQTQMMFSSLLSDSTQRELFGKTNEAHQRLFFDCVKRLIKPDLFLEVGAHDSTASKIIARNLESCQCHAFEADPDVFQKFFRTNVERNTLSNFHYHHMAASDKNGPISFYKQTKTDLDLNPLHVPNNSIRTKHTVEDYSRIEVPSSTIDRFCSDIEFENCVMWVDVEGMCYEVLQGSSATLEKCVAIYAEVEDYEIWSGQKTVFDIYPILEERGFIPVSRDIETVGQYNVLFLSRAKALERKFRSRIARYHAELAVINDCSKKKRFSGLT